MVITVVEPVVERALVGLVTIAEGGCFPIDVVPVKVAGEVQPEPVGSGCGERRHPAEGKFINVFIGTKEGIACESLCDAGACARSDNGTGLARRVAENPPVKREVPAGGTEFQRPELGAGY